MTDAELTAIEAKLVLPTVHMNGTSKQALLDGACAVANALNDVLSLLREHSPNQRDYYVKPETWRPACDQYDRRVNTVKALMQEVLIEAERIANQETALYLPHGIA